MLREYSELELLAIEYIRSLEERSYGNSRQATALYHLRNYVRENCPELPELVIDDLGV